MKRKLSIYIVPALAMILTAMLTVSALAANGVLTITVHPIHILVGGQVFQPRDANGEEVMVFTVNGTTYAPLRALAEAYGLEVGYDAATNTATVDAPGKSSISRPDFTAQWTVTEKPVTHYGNEAVFTAVYSGGLGIQDFKDWWKSFSAEEIARGAEQLAAEARVLSPGRSVTMYFSYGSYNLGTAWAFEVLEQSDFRPAAVWIK